MMANVKGMNSLIAVWLLFLSKECTSQELLQTKSGTVFAGNYTFFKVRADGHLRIELISSKGDADLFVGDVDLTEPIYNNYKLQSSTCGTDSVEISPTFKRPISVGVFGHPFAEQSRYHLSVYTLPQPDELTYHQLTLLLNNYEAIDRMMYGNHESSNTKSSARRSGSESSSSVADSNKEEEQEESLIWQVFITLLKVIVEALL